MFAGDNNQQWQAQPMVGLLVALPSQNSSLRSLTASQSASCFGLHRIQAEYTLNNHASTQFNPRDQLAVISN